MIRVNLLRNLGSTVTSSGTMATGVFQGGGLSDQDMQKTALIKLIAILIGPGLLMAYEKLSLESKQAELATVQAELQKVENKKNSYGSASPKVEKYTERKKKLDRQMEALRVLSRNRLREVKALDTVQSLMPPRTWIKTLEIDNGKVKMSGYASTETGVHELLSALSSSVFFSQIEPKSTEQEDTVHGPVKKFVVEFKVGKE